MRIVFFSGDLTEPGSAAGPGIIADIDAERLEGVGIDGRNQLL